MGGEGNDDSRPSSNCLLSYPTTLFFAYSNDFDDPTIGDIANDLGYFLSSYQHRNFARYGRLRFDLDKGHEEQVQLFDDLRNFTDSFENSLPDPSIGLKDPSTPSDVIDVVRSYVHNYPMCGTMIVLIVKRNPEEQDISSLIEVLQSNYFSVYTVASDQLLGGSSSKSLYELSTRTNGICLFTADTFDNANDLFYYTVNYPIYSVNILVNGQGSKTLPDLYVPDIYYYISSPLNVVGHPLSTDYLFISLEIDGASVKNGTNWKLSGDRDMHQGTMTQYGLYPNNNVFKMSVHYNYPSQVETVQLRIYTENPQINTWPKYDNNF